MPADRLDKLEEILNGGVRTKWRNDYHYLADDGVLRLRANKNQLILQNGNEIVSGMSNATYHAERQYVSSTALKLFDAKPERYRRLYVETEGPREPYMESSDYMKFGSLVHSILLDPEEEIERLYRVEDLGPDEEPLNLRKKLHRQWKESEERKHGYTIVSSEDFADAVAVAAAVERNKMAFDLVSYAPHAELSLFCSDSNSGLRMKARLDMLTMYENRPTILDIKVTTAESSPAGFGVMAARMGYDISAALYCMVFHKITGVMPRFIWVVLERDDDGDHACVLHESSNEDMMMAMGEVRDLLDDLTLATMVGFESPYYNKVNTVSYPAWRYRHKRNSK
jgi:hypothetical protein